MLSAQPPVALLQLAPVEPGQVYRRVCCTRKFVHQVVGTAIGCSAVHVIVGWLVATQFGKESFWKAADACLVMPGKQEKPRGVALVSEGIESCNILRHSQRQQNMLMVASAVMLRLLLVPRSLRGYLLNGVLRQWWDYATAHS